MAKKAYKMHKCTHPEKKKTEDEQCDVCKAYFDWIGMLYKLHFNDNFRIGGMLRNIEEDYYDYGGKLPSFLENPEWEKAKEQLKKDMGEEKKFDPPVGTEEERVCQIEEEGKKLEQIINGVDYWDSPDDEFRQRIAKDFEETRQIYRKHDCRGLSRFGDDSDFRKMMKQIKIHDRQIFEHFCPVCKNYMNNKWADRLYEEVLKNEKRFPDGMRKQLEEDFYFHQQKFDGDLPMFVENDYWIDAKKQIARWRADEEKKEKPKNEKNKAKEGTRQI